jgi:hypothetical protein
MCFVKGLLMEQNNRKKEQPMQSNPSGVQNSDRSPQRQRWTRWQIIVPLVAILVLTLVGIVPLLQKHAANADQQDQTGNASQASKEASWKRIWGDEFDSKTGANANPSNWLFDTGTGYAKAAVNWGTGENEVTTTSTNNVYTDGKGHLAIKAVREADGTWTSGRIESQRSDFAAPVGGKLAVEASIQVPNVTGAAAQGYWPAFWMLGAAFRGNYNNWPSIGELDAMENLNGTNVEHGTMHCGVDPGGPCNETTGLGGVTNCAPTTCQAGFHTYRVEVDRSTSPEEVRWYLDGKEFWHVDSNRSGMDAKTWSNAVDQSFFIILNVAMGGGWPGNPTAATKSGVPMLVDYVHVYTSGGKTGTSGTATPTSTTTPTSATTPTATPTATYTTTSTATPTTTSGSTAGSFTQGVTSTDSSSAQLCFTPSGTTAYVILHYTLPGGGQQNVQMTYNASTARWESSVAGLSSGQALQYSFTYQKDGQQSDTDSYSWTHP